MTRAKDDFVPSFPDEGMTSAIRALLEYSTGTKLPAPAALTGASEESVYAATSALACARVADAIEVSWGTLDTLLRARLPFVLRVLREEVYAVVPDGRWSTVLPARGAPVRVPTRMLARKLRDLAQRPANVVATRLAQRIRALGASKRAHQRLTTGLHQDLFSSAPFAVGYVFRDHHAASTRQVWRSLGVSQQVALSLVFSLLQGCLGLGSWYAIGSLALRGHADRAGILGWAVLSLTAALVQAVAVHQVGRFTLRAGTRARQRLLEGAFRLDPDRLGQLGFGGLVVVASQADAFLPAVLGLFFAGIGFLTHLVSTLAALSLVPYASWFGLLFTVAAATLVVLARPIARAERRLQEQRLVLTTHLVERMLGHSTRLVQQTPNSFHDGEDDIVHRYSNAATRSDFLQIVARAVPRGFYLLSVVGVFFVLVASPHQAVLALTLGALALGVTALGSLGEILVAGAGLVALWRSLKPVVDDDVMMQERAHEAIADTGDDGKGHVVEMRGVGFAYRGRSRPVFDDLTLEIAQGERVLIEGRSGGGKTTLAALLAGLRKPSSGLVFVKGLDQHTISETQLRRIIASAPQFYRNHVFTESFAFNLLLGRNWPPAREDLQAATEVCHAVGLGPLLEQMPGGLFQHVGETGWKLSHGERSRVFLARTLLQTSECLILDETFGALDPTTLRQCMTTVLRRARTLVVITHR